MHIIMNIKIFIHFIEGINNVPRRKRSLIDLITNRVGIRCQQPQLQTNFYFY